MKSLGLFIIIWIVSLTTLTGVEFVTEHMKSGTRSMLLIPYSDLFYRLEDGVKSFDNSVTVAIHTEDEEIIYQEQFRINFNLDAALLEELEPIEFNREYYPLSFDTELDAGKYQLYVAISTGGAANRKKELRKSFTFPERMKDTGYLFIEAEIGQFRFIVRDENHLLRGFDSIEFRQYKEYEPDSMRVVIESTEESETIRIDELARLPEILRDKENFEILLESYHQGRKYVSSPVYPNPAYFFQQIFTPQEQLSQLRYIVNQNEYQYLRSLSDEQLQEGINEYWDSRDPDPYTVDNVYQETFYQRVRYADDNYQIKGYLPGWRTDMGRIYITYGEPDRIVSDVFPLGRPPSITWQYYSLNKVFVFYDFRGYGQYELRNKWID
jgi:GWxTD domain-containing protein